MNRADPTLIEYVGSEGCRRRGGANGRYMKYHIDNVDASQGPTYETAKKFGQMLLDNCMSRIV